MEGDPLKLKLAIGIGHEGHPLSQTLMASDGPHIMHKGDKTVQTF